MRIAFLAAIFVSLAACSPAAEESAPPAQSPPQEQVATPSVAVATGELEMFTSPTGNIGCTYVPAGGTEIYQPAAPGAELTCDRVEPSYVRIVMPENAAAAVVQTDERGCCSGEALAYGQTWSRGPFTCQSSEAGLSCRSARGATLTLSRTRADAN